MRFGKRILAFACLLAVLTAGLVVAGSPAAAGEGVKWSDEDFRTRAVDHTFFTGGGKGDKKWKAYIYYQPDGRVFVKAWGKDWRNRIEGTWKIESDRWCTAYDDKNWGVGCYEFSDKGDKVLIKRVSGTNKGSKFLMKLVGKGNVKNLE